MNALPLRHPGETQHYAQSWVFSVLLHALAVGTAILMVADLKLAPQPETFKWDVAMVETPTPPQPVEATPPPAAKPKPVVPTPPQPVERPTPVQKARPAPPVQQIVRQQLVTQVQPIERVTTPPVMTRQTQSIVEVPQQTYAVTAEVSAPTETREIVRETAVATAGPQQIVTETVTAAAETRPVTESAVPIAEPQPTVRETATRPTETRQVTEAAATATETHPLIQETAAIAPSQSVTQHVVNDAMPVPSAESSIVSQGVVETPAQQQASTVVQEQAMVREPAIARHLPARSMPATKADYGWLAQALWSRVEQLKRYPAMARMNRWEGKVVLRAVIRDTGELVDLQVAESSGHAVLDRDALEVMRRASPITLKHSLGQSQVVLQIPISYKLK